MKKVFVLFVVLSVLLSCKAQQEMDIVFVSPTAETNGDGTQNSPFSNISAAMQKAKEIKSINPEANILVNILPGTYYLSESIKIDASLNGLSIKGTDASDVIIKGAIPLNLKWEKFNESIYVTSVEAGLEFDQFVVNNNPQILARYPNYNEGGHYWQGYAEDAISKERLESWKNPEGAFFHALHGGRWGGFHFEITGVNEDGTPKLTGGHQNNRGSRPHKEYRMVENVFKELDAPGEWFLDKTSSKLYYWPTENVSVENATFEVAVLKDLIQVTGTIEEPAKNITISGITLENTARTFMEDFEPLLRSDWTIYRGAVLFFEGTENCKIENSEFANLGGNVIMASKYNKGLQVIGNHIHDCGASAISFVGDVSAVRSPSLNYREFVPLEEMDTIAGPKNELYPRACLVEDNLIYRIGRTEKQTAGVQISMAMDITVSHNSIYDVPRAGINIGDGTWGGHILEYNDVFNTVLETSDHGSFNSWGRDRFWYPNRKIMDSLTTANPEMPKWDAIKTTIIRNNRFRCDHGWDIDLDDGSSNYHIYNNLCLNSGIKLREGFKRVVTNNITVNNSLHPHVWFAKSEDIFKNNIVGDTYQDVGLLGWGKELDYNLFPTEESMMKPQIYGMDKHSAFGDPLFIDPCNLDFGVTKDSPALNIGFKNFPMDQFGVKKAKFKAIAKTPEVPVLKDPTSNNGKASPVVAWLRNNIKNVESEQEQSAYGLNTDQGVIVLRVWKHSPAVKGNGIKKGDVILQSGDVKISTIKDFFKIMSKSESDTMNLVVMRNQTEQEITIHLK
ncbi:PDZ domain-containing protein [Seonamhaeicola maritimus]|nr:PDZ domain-containing protein [Seonamhaeicola maritimus]